MILASNQPYLFPYLAYWQLINYADVFVIADKLQYTKRSYISRNSILLNKRAYMFILEVFGAGSGKSIDELLVGNNAHTILKTVRYCYSRAPFYSKVYPIIENILLSNEKNLAKFINYSIIKISEYLNINTKFSYHSLDSILGREYSVIKLCKDLKAEAYINAINGQKLYSKSKFLEEGVQLNFLKMGEVKYKQFNNEFVPNLSIIDLMMFNSVEDIRIMLNNFELI